MTAPTIVRPAASAGEPPDEPDSTAVITQAPIGRNLLAVPAIGRALRSRWYPKILQIPVAAVFGLVAYELLLGPAAAHDNAGSALMWVLWWPLIPVVFLLLGRFWCAVCPFGALSDLVQRLVGANQPVPRFLKCYGIWIIDASFLTITWSDHVWGVVESAWGSGVLLLLLTTAVIASGAFFQRRTFCRYLCFLGGLAGNYARVGMVELRADPDVCRTCKSRAVCYNGSATAAGCPMFNFPRMLESNADCTLCANCVKACPNDAIQLRVRKPASELWFINKPKTEESFLAMAIMGIVLIQNLTMLSVWKNVLGWVHSFTGITNDALIFTLAFAVAVAVPVALLAGASRIAAHRNAEGVLLNFARFGYALIPLDVAAHIAHNLFHLLAEGRSIGYTIAELFGAAQHDGSAAVAGPGTIHVLQYAVLALGFAGSIYTARRIAYRRYATPARRSATLRPYVAVITVLAALNVYLFLLPMAHRM